MSWAGLVHGPCCQPELARPAWELPRPFQQPSVSLTDCRLPLYVRGFLHVRPRPAAGRGQRCVGWVGWCGAVRGCAGLLASGRRPRPMHARRTSRRLRRVPQRVPPLPPSLPTPPSRLFSAAHRLLQCWRTARKWSGTCGTSSTRRRRCSSEWWCAMGWAEGVGGVLQGRCSSQRLLPGRCPCCPALPSPDCIQTLKQPPPASPAASRRAARARSGDRRPRPLQNGTRLLCTRSRQGRPLSFVDRLLRSAAIRSALVSLGTCASH